MDVKLKIISCKKIKIKNKTAKHLLKKQQQQLQTTITSRSTWSGLRFSNSNTVTHSSSTPSTHRNATVSFYKNKRFSLKHKHRNDYENLDNCSAMNNNSNNGNDNDMTADTNANANHDECDNNDHENATCR